jgi:tetratricopeptide (TPR) repeat protein
LAFAGYCHAEPKEPRTMNPTRPIRIALCLAMIAFAGAPRAGLLGADEILRRIETRPAAADKDALSVAAQLLADIQRYREQADALDSKQSAQAWLSLFDRASRIGRLSWQGEYREFDRETNNVVGLQSVLASVPPPDAWPALLEAARGRAAAQNGNVEAHSVRLLAELLAGNRSAAEQTLNAVAAIVARQAPQEREAKQAQVAHLRAEIARLYGSPAEVTTAFLVSLETQGKRPFGEVTVPDLVGLVGAERAESILTQALGKPVRLAVPEGDATRRIARRIALAQVASLPVAQWGLVDSIEGAALYEALERRFVGAAARDARGPQAAAADAQVEFRKRDADAYYFLAQVIQGRQDEAERVLRAIAGEQSLHVPRPAIEALQRAGHHQALYRFLHAALGRRPELRAWEVYTKEAARAGASAEALALIEAALARKDLPGYVIADLRRHRVNALLAADKVDAAVAAMRELLAPQPRVDEATLFARTTAAVRLAGLGRVLARRELVDAGLSFARAALAVARDDGELSWRRGELLQSVFAEQRRSGLAEAAQALALAELQRVRPSAEQFEQLGMQGAAPGVRAAIIELAGIFGEAGRTQDVLALLRGSAKWGARDLAAVLTEKDSLGVPIGLIAARALAAGGAGTEALTIARALVDAMPGYDPAYELLVELDKDAVGSLSRAYARDQFEERPLIWMAVVFARQGRLEEAESVARRAITVDPSDGEQGVNDRMRAYAVLASVLEAKGVQSTAGLFRRAVAAIRISERSDELHRLGLYDRAFAGYRAALEQFADAYCIQSRLAVRLYEQGRRSEALEHYRRAYELMPSSFGRVESHCFGCESVFQGVEQQQLAEKVFSGLVAKEPANPQAQYMLAYLQKERGRHAEALKGFREAARLDSEYLNAWKHLHDLAARVYIAPRERDAVRLRLLELDPRQRHVRYELDSVGDLEALWRAVSAARAAQPRAPAGDLYVLRAGAAAQDEALGKLPEAMRAQVHLFQALSMAEQPGGKFPGPRQAIARHKLVRATGALLGIQESGLH